MKPYPLTMHIIPWAMHDVAGLPAHACKGVPGANKTCTCRRSS